MLRLLTPIMASLVLCGAVPTPTHAAEDGSKLIGLWQEETDGYKVVWSIGYWNGKWSVSAALHKPNEKKGVWLGADVRLTDGKLTFTRKPAANAPATVMEDAKVTVQPVKDGELSYSTEKGGPHTLTRSTEVALAPDVLPGNGGAAVVADNGKPKREGASAPTAGGKPPEDAKKYAGKWSGNGEVHGFKEIWTIQVNDDAVAVNGTFVDPKGKRPTCYISGVNVRFEGGKLIFNQQLGAGCPASMGNNTKITVEADAETLSYRYFGGSRNLTRLSRSAIETGLIGTWAGEIDGLTEVVIVKRAGTRWQVGASILHGNRPVSGWKGMDVKLADGKLTFTRKLRTVPAGWMDKSQCTLEWDGGNLSYNFVNGDTKGEPRKLKPLSK